MAEPGHSSASESAGQSATEWRLMFIAGTRAQAGVDPDLAEGAVVKLLRDKGVRAAIVTEAMVDPRFLINAKGTTPWQAMYVLVKVRDPAGLRL